MVEIIFILAIPSNRCNYLLLNFIGLKQSHTLYSNIITTKGMTSELYCNITMPFNRGNTSKQERLQRVIWFKDNELVPMYVYYRKIEDAKNTSIPKFMHWSDSKVVQNRASFYADSAHDLACLQLKNVKTTDAGVYTCRVDYSIGFATESEINFSVIVPPFKPVITDITKKNERLNGILSNTLGPYRIGSDINICCSVAGGNPTPKITWWKNSILKKPDFVNLKTEKVESCLSIKNVAQEDNSSLFTCKADNGGSENYSSVKLKLLSKSLDIKNQVKNNDMNISKDLVFQESNKTVTDNMRYNYILTMKSSCPTLQGIHCVLNILFILLCMV